MPLHALSALAHSPWPLHALMPAHFTTVLVFLAVLPFAIDPLARNMEATAEAMAAFLTFMDCPCEGRVEVGADAAPLTSQCSAAIGAGDLKRSRPACVASSA